MKPNPQFVQMVSTRYQSQNKPITQLDLAFHNLNDVTYYSLSYGKFANDRLITKTEGFSDQIMIEITKGGKETTIGTPSSNVVYRGISLMNFETYMGRGFFHWHAKDAKGVTYVMVRLTTEKNEQQLKIVNTSNSQQEIHNICQLP